jgi:hypothetical protein
MAIDAQARQVIVVTRRPARLIAYSMNGTVTANLPACGDADDVFVDEQRHRLYISCGDGVVDVLERRASEIVRVGQVTTASGARTALFVPSLDRLFVAARATFTEPATIMVFRPLP